MALLAAMGHRSRDHEIILLELKPLVLCVSTWRQWTDIGRLYVMKAIRMSGIAIFDNHDLMCLV